MSTLRPDLVLLDLMMPGMSGFEVIAAMQTSPHLADVPVVVLTGKTLTEQELEQLNQGVAAVLSKGLFSAQETLRHLETALQRGFVANPETRRLVRRAMAYIHEHYMEPIARKEIAAHVSISARHLDRCFSDEIGITPMAYLNRFRLRDTRRLLQSTALSISEVAATRGFSDSSYFCRVFRRDLGMFADRLPAPSGLSQYIGTSSGDGCPLRYERVPIPKHVHFVLAQCPQRARQHYRLQYT